MKTHIFFVLAAFVSLAACSHKETAVNDDGTPAILPMTKGPTHSAPMEPSPDTITTGAIGRAPNVAIEGKVLIKDDIPLPVPHAQLGLYRKESERWFEITRMTTENDGSFRITQKLKPGSYEIRILDKKYEGTQSVRLDRTPVRGVIFYVTRK